MHRWSTHVSVSTYTLHAAHRSLRASLTATVGIPLGNTCRNDERHSMSSLAVICTHIITAVSSTVGLTHVSLRNCLGKCSNITWVVLARPASYGHHSCYVCDTSLRRFVTTQTPALLYARSALAESEPAFLLPEAMPLQRRSRICCLGTNLATCRRHVPETCSHSVGPSSGKLALG